jgi:hypothetical protein
MMEREEHLAPIGGMRNEYNILAKESGRKRTL